MKAIFEVPVQGWEPQMLPMQSENGYQLMYDDNGMARGGFSCIGQGPLEPNGTRLVLIEAHENVIALMKQDDKYTFVEDVAQEEVVTIVDPADVVTRPVLGITPPPKLKPGDLTKVPIKPVSDERILLEKLAITDNDLAIAGITLTAKAVDDPIEVVTG